MYKKLLPCAAIYDRMNMRFIESENSGLLFAGRKARITDMNLKKAIAYIISSVMICGLFCARVDAADNILAFPGAEGGGKYTKGARNASSPTVYHVTSLGDSGTGTLRDAVSKAGRIIVFDVSGIIELESRLDIRKNNLTILGQTAPGDGITISGYDVLLGNNVDNVIIRHLRIRPTDRQNGEPDGLGGRWISNIVIDHCSVSWGVDEMLTIYSGSLEDGKESDNKPAKEQSKNISVQNCISSESLRMSSHFKGAHGYGGIIGGTNATYHHNLFANHDSRNPRLDRNLKSTDMVNNVIYNWGNNSCYGAEPYSYNAWTRYSAPEYASNLNIRNNYYKFGPSTKQSIRYKIFEATNSGKVSYNGQMAKSNIYINGNYVFGNSEATQNNTASESYVLNRERVNLLGNPISMGEYEIPAESAEEGYEYVLNNVGATLPKRDSIDARIVNDVKNGTGRIINGIKEVGGFSGITSEKRIFSIPSDWKTANGMGNKKETDIVSSGAWKGYTWIEAYVYDWTQKQSAPTNPDITVNSPAIADTSKTADKTGGKGFWEITEANTPVTYSANAQAKAGTAITKTELYDGEELIYTSQSDKIDQNITLAAGVHYLTSKAYNNKGESTTSPTSIVYVTKNGSDADKKGMVEIGKTSYPAKNAVWTDNGTTYIAGSGLIGGKSDSFSYSAHSVNGDFEFSVKIGDIPKYENGTLCGIMFRESLDNNSRMVMLSDGWKKYGENIQIMQRDKTGGNAVMNWLRDKSGNEIKNDGNYDTTDETKNLTLPKYMKIARNGNKLTISVSNDGVDWTNNIRQPLTIDISGWSDNAYIGLAVDSVAGNSNEANPMLPWYSIASFSDIKATGLSEEIVIPTPTPTPSPTPSPTPTLQPTETPQETLIPTEEPQPTPTPFIQRALYDNRKQQAVIYSAEDTEATVIFACYEDGRLINVAIKKNEIIKMGLNEIPKPQEFDDSLEYVKIYVWYSLDSMRPVM